MISGFAKSYNLDPKRVLEEYSFANIMMYGAVLPSYNSDRKTEEQKFPKGGQTDFKNFLGAMRDLKK